jgi:AcrR family transcriptional regulator
MSGAFSFGHSSAPPQRAVLIVAHPGHELRVHGWLERTRPEVHVLTDGAGHGAHARLASTTAVIEGAGVRSGRIYGRYSDRAFYEAMLDRRLDVFVQLAEELADAIAAADPSVVACDAIEGYNPSHDVCRLISGAAVALASRRVGRTIEAYDFPLVDRPDACPDHLRPAAIRHELDAAALARKLAAADRYPELRDEVRTALEQLGVDAFRIECLRPHEANGLAAFEAEAPFYERHGRRRVAEGVYRDVLTFRDHVRPIADALGRELVP